MEAIPLLPRNNGAQSQFSRMPNAGSPIVMGMELISRDRLAKWIDSLVVQRIVLGLIILNAITLGLETSQTVIALFGTTIFWFINYFILAAFVVELSIRLLGHGLKFFAHPWNWFDLIIIGASILSGYQHEQLGGKQQQGYVVFRILRVLRILRIMKVSPKLKIVIETLLSLLPSLGWIICLLLIFYYIWALIGTNLFGKEFNDWFGTVGRSLYTLFQVMTLESWSMGISRPVMEKYPYAFLFFVPFILMSSYTVINIFIAMVVNTMQGLGNQQQQELQQQLEDEYNDIENLTGGIADDELDDNDLLVWQEVTTLKNQMQRVEKLLERALKRDAHSDLSGFDLKQE